MSAMTRPQRRGGALLLSIALAVPTAAFAQAEKAAPAATVVAPDPYGRETPRAAITELLGALGEHEYDRAAHYFDLPVDRDPRVLNGATELAKRLQAKMPELTLQMVLTEGYPRGEAPIVDIDVVPADPTTSVRAGHLVTPLMTDHFVALVPADHRLAGRRRVEMAELAEDSWISNDISAGITQEMVDRACRAAGFRPRYTVEAQDHYTATAFVAAGVGITVLPDLASRTIPKSVRRLRLTNPNPVRDIVALTAPVARSNEAATLAVDLLQQIAAASARRR